MNAILPIKALNGVIEKNSKKKNKNLRFLIYNTLLCHSNWFVRLFCSS